MLFIGLPGDLIENCRGVWRPARLDSSKWKISELLYQFKIDIPTKEVYDQRVNAKEALSQ